MIIQQYLTLFSPRRVLLMVLFGILGTHSLPGLAKTFQMNTVFEANRGQASPDVRFLARTGAYWVVCRAQSCAWRLSGQEIAVKLVGATPARPLGEGRLARVHRFYKGHEAYVAPTFQRVVYRNVYAGIDMVYRLADDAVEYDWIVAPGADVAQIHMQLPGAERTWLDAQGNLHVAAGPVQWVHHAPLITQTIAGKPVAVAGRFIKHADGSWGIALAERRNDVALLIDPKVSLARFVGGSGGDDFEGVAVGAAEANYYVVGSTTSADMSVPVRAYNSKRDVYVAKINATSGAVSAVTYLGGSNEDTGHAITVDTANSDRIYITGATLSDNFPHVVGTSQPQEKWGTGLPGSPVAPDAFVAVLDNSLTLLNTTYYGGEGKDAGRAIVYKSPYIYVAGTTDSRVIRWLGEIKSSPNGIDAFVIKIFEENSSTWGLAFASRFGGSGDDYGVGLDVDGGGNIYLAGHSNSSDLLTPVGSDYSYKSFVGDACLRGSLSASESPNFRCRDVFLTKWTQSMLNQYSIAFTTYLGGGADELVSRVRVVGTTILLAGATQSGLVDVGTGAKLAADNPGLRLFPLYHRAPGVAIPSVHQGTDFDAFVVGFNATGSELLFSTLLGGGSADNINGMAVWTRPSGVMDIIVAGYTASEDFPLRNPAQAIVRQSDGFLARLVYDSTAVDPLSLATSTLMGGQGADFFYDVALVNQGLKWVAVGGTESADAPVVNTTSALQAMRDGWLTVWDESGFTFVDQGIQASTSASSVNLGESVTYQLTLSRDQLGLIDDQPRLWVVLPEDNAQISSSLPGCVLRENIYSCPFVLLATQTVNISITPGFKGSYRVKFGVGGLYADAVPANNRVDTHVTVVHHTSTSASDPWLIGFLILWGVLGLRSGRTVV